MQIGNTLQLTIDLIMETGDEEYATLQGYLRYFTDLIFFRPKQNIFNNRTHRRHLDVVC